MVHQGLHQSWTVLLCASNSSYAQKVGAKVGSLFEVRFFSIVFAHLANSTGGDGDRLLGVSSHVRKRHNLLIYKGLIATGHLMLYHPI